MISSTAEKILIALRASVESECHDSDGKAWGNVYLDNARPSGMSARSFAGYLSALESAGLYRSIGDDCFGDVLLDE